MNIYKIVTKIMKYVYDMDCDCAGSLVLYRCWNWKDDRDYNIIWLPSLAFILLKDLIQILTVIIWNAGLMECVIQKLQMMGRLCVDVDVMKLAPTAKVHGSLWSVEEIMFLSHIYHKLKVYLNNNRVRHNFHRSRACHYSYSEFVTNSLLRFVIDKFLVFMNFLQ